jgi:hypothetical protein
VRGIPTFPQLLRRLLGYIFNVSIAELKVTFLNVLIRLHTGIAGTDVSLRFQIDSPRSLQCNTQRYPKNRFVHNASCLAVFRAQAIWSGW